jgi:invasion protein IalB
MIRLVSAGIFAASLATGAVAQQQPANPKQFGPRVNSGGAGAAAAPNRPAPDLIAENGKWKVQCETRPAGKDAQGRDVPAMKACAMVQVSRDEKRPQVALSLIMRQQKQGNKQATMMQIMAPIGVFLPTGIALEIDGRGRGPGSVRALPAADAGFAAAVHRNCGSAGGDAGEDAQGCAGKLHHLRGARQGHQAADLAERLHRISQGAGRQQLGSQAPGGVAQMLQSVQIHRNRHSLHPG